MKTDDFDYDLPNELIAEYPLKDRSSSRLLIFNKIISHDIFSNITESFSRGDLLVVNNTSVIPARIFGKKESGGLVEILLERILEKNRALVQIRSGNSPKEGTKIYFDEYEVICEGREKNFYIIKFKDDPYKIFNIVGHIPLPPYIKRKDEKLDAERYGTVYQDKNLQDSVAAPTAGLHFDEKLLSQIKNLGIEVVNINLSVGAGTFQPVKSENIEDHKIHKEFVEVSDNVVAKILQTKSAGNKVIAVGTTALRAIETAFCGDQPKSFKGDTNLFIYPGFKFKAADMLITNFHLPKSSLLMLVAAFIGFENMKFVYEIALAKKYRFLSYGDAMLLSKNEI